MEFFGDFRKNAAECFRWAQSATNPRDWLARLNMAQLWLRLAQDAEKRKMAGDKPPDLPAAGDDALGDPDRTNR